MADGLGLKGHLADLVKEQRAVVGPLEKALGLPVCAGKRALLMPEEPILEKLLGHACAIECDEAEVLAGAVGVYLLGHGLLARAALSKDQHAGTFVFGRLENPLTDPGYLLAGASKLAAPEANVVFARLLDPGIP